MVTARKPWQLKTKIKSILTWKKSVFPSIITSQTTDYKYFLPRNATIFVSIIQVEGSSYIVNILVHRSEFLNHRGYISLIKFLSTISQNLFLLHGIFKIKTANETFIAFIESGLQTIFLNKNMLLMITFGYVRWSKGYNSSQVFYLL